MARFAVRALTSALLVVAVHPGSLPGQNVELTGRALLGPDSLPIAGLEVELHRIAADTSGVIATGTTGEDGDFGFQIEPGGDDAQMAVYLATARYEGVLYFGRALHALTGSVGDYRIRVWETTPVASPQIDRRRIVIRPAGPRAAVSDLIELANNSSSTQLSPDSVAAGWLVPLPAGAGADARATGPLSGNELVVRDDAVQLLGPVPPGGRSFAVEYSLNLGETSLAVDRAVATFELLLDIRFGDIRVDGLERGGIEQLPDEAFVRWVGAELPIGTVLRFRLPSQPNLRRWAWLTLAAGFFLLGGAIFAWNRARP